MLSYRHGFHAGNHADVFKHVTLALCLEALARKPTPYFLLDTHAGSGRYDLDGEFAQTTGESEVGIRSLWPDCADALPDSYQRALRAWNTGSRLRFYPGSCALMADALRAQDMAVFCERHSTEQQLLERTLGRRRRVRIVAGDGFAQIRTVLPPTTGRGLILLDPSYETAADYSQVATAVAEIHRRFRAGIVLVWLPVLPAANRLLSALQRAGSPGSSAWLAELAVRPAGDRGLHASAMYVLNPPWQVDQQLAACMATIAPRLHQSQADGFRIQALH